VLTRYTIGPLHCAVNSDLPAGRGTDDVAPANVTSQVLVVGGGLAGLEAARTAALRGHDVVLAESRTTPGGTAAIAARVVANLSLVDDIVQWEVNELSRLGVDVRLGLTLEPEQIRDFDAATVIVATGSVAKADAVQAGEPGVVIPGAELSHVTRVPEVFDLTTEQLGVSAVVLDSQGSYVALAVCEYLAARGLFVTLVTHFASVGHPVIPGRRVLGAIGRLNATGRFGAAPLTVVVKISPGRVDVRDLAGQTGRSIAADTVVMVLGDDPEAEIPTALEESGKTMAVVGDALMPRGIRTAIADGHRAGMTV
jgi:NADPH-dependent 2,4-dienoyl-CoA reductase/sulfur reductase-like enzyme